VRTRRLEDKGVQPSLAKLFREKYGINSMKNIEIYSDLDAPRVINLSVKFRININAYDFFACIDLTFECDRPSIKEHMFEIFHA